MASLGQKLRTNLRAVILMSALLPVVCNAEAPAPPSVEDFFRNPAFRQAVLSPDGKRLAVLVGTVGQRQKLAVLEAGSWDKVKIVAALSHADIDAFSWVNDGRLIFSIADFSAGFAEQAAAGIYAVDVDGGELRQLVGTRPASTGTMIESRVLSERTQLHSTLRDGSDDVVLAQPDEDYTRLLRLNTRSGIARPLSANGPKGARAWILDPSGAPSYVIAKWDGHLEVSRWDKTLATWVQMGRWPTYSNEGWYPSFVGYHDELYVTALDKKGTEALYLFDQTTNRPQPEPVVRIDGFDYLGYVEVDPAAKKLLGTHFVADAPSTYWFDAEMKKAQERIDAQLPASNNVISCGRCLSSQFLLVRAQSDREPGTFYVYEVTTGKLQRIARQRPWLDPRAMGRRDFFRVPARDGLSIPTWITLPPNYEKGRIYPAVVLIHGGPWVRGANWLWAEEPQFLATRGYVVIEPEFRGSTGYGDPHFRAGFKQWGLAMQDDVADATRWAIAQGYVDRKRVCIAGANYGGYAVLMGLIRDPDLYRCGINQVGVTDLQLAYTSVKSDMTDQYRRYDLAVLLGDPGKDAEQLRNTSPVHNAARITQPLLMVYGGENRRVPVEHGRRLYDVLIKTNPNVEWVLYPSEGNGLFLEKNRFDFYGRVERFLATHLKGAD